MGIEPTPQAWEAGVLPLNYTRALCDHLIIACLIPNRQWLCRGNSSPLRNRDFPIDMPFVL